MLKEYKIVKEKYWIDRWIRIYQTETGAFLVLEESDADDYTGNQLKEMYKVETFSGTYYFDIIKENK